jgi:DNA-binding FrmR family transcriptional regulator
MTVHASHPDIIKRLKRAAGHLKSTIQMLEDEKHVWISPSNCTLWKRR